MDKSKCTRLLVAAFDFGTTYSGYAFSFRDEPLQVKTNLNWIAGSEKLISLKTPTCVLLKPNKEFHSFGFEAENKYTSLAEDDEHHGWYLFRRFKMVLHDTRVLSRDLVIEDISGKKCEAMTIFAMSIRYLKEHLLDTLNNQMTGVEPTDIEFVITVPAIWDDSSKQFMREAAIEAGIPTDQLRIALEPEAASVWCQIISTEKQMPGLNTSGLKYMVVDLGGGTADITVHEKAKDGSLKELHKASGGAWGGNEVDKAYIKMLTEIVGEPVMDRFKREQMGDYFDILREFETKKRTITPDKEGRMTFKIPALLKEMYEEKGNSIKTRLSNTNLGTKLTWAGDKIRLDIDIAKSWFHVPCQSLIGHIKSLLQKPNLEEVGTVLLVGGFGECQLIQDEFRKAFKGIRLVVPEEAGLVVLKGAVRFGHMPHVVSQRISKFSYGIEVWPSFDPKKHSRNKIVNLEGENSQCREVFHEIVKVGEELTMGRTFTQQDVPASAGARGVVIRVFCSSQDSPKYVTDPGCKKLGEIIIDLPDGKLFDIFFIFGDTELHVKVRILKTGKEYETYIDCL